MIMRNAPMLGEAAILSMMASHSEQIFPENACNVSIPSSHKIKNRADQRDLLKICF